MLLTRCYCQDRKSYSSRTLALTTWSHLVGSTLRMVRTCIQICNMEALWTRRLRGRITSLENQACTTMRTFQEHHPPLKAEEATHRNQQQALCLPKQVVCSWEIERPNQTLDFTQAHSSLKTHSLAFLKVSYRRRDLRTSTKIMPKVKLKVQSRTWINAVDRDRDELDLKWLGRKASWNDRRVWHR